MSTESSPADTTTAEPAVCEFCGFVIDDPHKQCPALHNGGCQP
ncbi:hypothetical protein [Halobaculum sp. D14]